MPQNNILNHSKIADSDPFFKKLQKYLKENEDDTAFVINAPLIENFKYDNADKYFVILRSGYKLIFCNYQGEEQSFNDYKEDFKADMGTLAGKYKYQEHIGRPKKWFSEYTAEATIDNEVNFNQIFDSNKLPADKKRFSDLLISLLTGNIQDLSKVGVETPNTPLENVRKKIVLFDVDQTRFIYTEPKKKMLSTQGLSGTGKTELLLHRLKDLYSADDTSKIFFTCHNKALAKTLNTRIPDFFDLMQTTKQIKWKERLWVSHAWGSYWDPNSGFYSYLCSHYGATFHRYSPSKTYQDIFQSLLQHIQSLPKDKQKPCFDYILVDESQDFPEVFFKVCEIVASKKVYAAGDVFQKIYSTKDEGPRHVDIILKRCYRTDPRTLMFGHAVGLGLNERIRYNWLTKDEWLSMGYKYSKAKNKITIRRHPVNRPNGIDCENSVEIIKDGKISQIITIINTLKEEYADIKAHDIAIIMLDDDQKIYGQMDQLVALIQQKLKWSATRGHEKKEVQPNHVYVTNSNNVKGLEFPFVICYSGKVKDTIGYRNILYTMLTRSFIKTYLILEDDTKVEEFKTILDDINKNKKVTFIEATEEEENQIKLSLMEYNEDEIVKSMDELLDEVFNELNIDDETRMKKLRQMVSANGIEITDKKTLSSMVSDFSRWV